MEENKPVGGYGYGDDEATMSVNAFGLNAAVTYLTKFEYIPNGGEDGAEQDALDIKFLIEDKEKSHRLFPPNKVFDKKGNEIEDRDSVEYKAGYKDQMGVFNAAVTHVLSAFQERDTVKAALSAIKPETTFKEFCEKAAAMLPKGYETRLLDIFLQYQWQFSKNQTRTFLEIPKKTIHGKWLCPAKAGDWKENRAEEIKENTKKAMWYTNEKGEEHPFMRTGWFMRSNFAKLQQTDDDTTNNNTGGGGQGSAQGTAEGAGTQQQTAVPGAAKEW